MRTLALCKWLQRHRTRSVPKPRRTVLGINSLEDRRVPTALTGSVYQDLNHNGVRDAGEPGIAGVKIHLVGKTDAGAVVNMDAVTDSQGNYTFDGLTSGVYMLIEKHAAGFKNGSATAGSDGGTVVGPNVIRGIDVCHCDMSGYNFGELPNGSSQNHDPCGDGGKVKGNNGVGNGLDPQPPGNPPVNDGPGTSPGAPGNRGGK